MSTVPARPELDADGALLRADAVDAVRRFFSVLGL